MADRRRAVWRASLGVPVAFVAVLAIEALVAVSRQYPDDPGYPIDVLVEPAAGEALDSPVRLAMLGDSTVVGVGAQTLDGALAVQTAQRVADALGRQVSVHGLGVSGATTRDVLRDQVSSLTAGRYDVVIVVIGGNDVTHLTPPWRIDDDTSMMLDEIRRRVDAPIVVGGIPLFSGVTAMAQPLRWVADSYAALLRRQQRGAAESAAGVSYVNIAVQASPRFRGVADAMSADGFHPGATGYGFWADALAPAIVATQP